MFKWIKRIFHRTRLIERYENLDAIIDAHNALIRKSLDIMRDASVPPKYVLARFKAIQDAEEKAIAAYWRNKDRKQDKWYRHVKADDSSTMSDTVQDSVKYLPNNPAVPFECPDSESHDVTSASPSAEAGAIEIHITK